MEGVSTRVYKGLREYWRRRGYERLNGAGCRRKRRVELAVAGSKRKRRFWRIKITPKLRFSFSPKKFFIGLRDAYVKMMLGLANSPVVNSGGISGVAGDGTIGAPRCSQSWYPDRRLMVLAKIMC
ncbi:hypothetical protein F0562_000797 [Nyssa sinensis]|uniref:Uncharacterized protein n=1 Tax=Nyssa sinensis TaxID=561372 RepID=A0A5J5C151_9ASTE|nr:hypothetical protein F0562_000797 [Nyssa sinensis]